MFFPSLAISNNVITNTRLNNGKLDDTTQSENNEFTIFLGDK